MRRGLYVFALLLLAQPAWANPWLPATRGGQLITSTIATYSNGSFESIPDPTGLPRFTLCNDLEYGITSDIALLVSADLQRFAPGDLNVGPNGMRMDRAMGGARVAIWRSGGTIISVEALGGADAVYDNTPHSIFSSMRAAAEARIMLGQNFTVLGLDSFATLEAGGRWRAGPPADEATLDATFGVAPAPRWLLLLQSFSTESIDDAQAPYQRYLLSKAQLSAAFRVYGGMWLQAGAFDSVAQAHTGAEHGGLVSLWWKF